MASFWRTKSFKKLTQVWEKKLNNSGFKDVEKLRSASTCYRVATELERNARIDYYSVIGHQVHNTKFSNELEEIVMVMHAEGATIKEILQELFVLKRIKRDRKTIRYIIRRWQTKWGIKSWSPKQMNLKIQNTKS